ncbi:unnamed protein product [Vitrella brassicaformis CCMP3155]|uniref:Dickkopf N-terminal cysteine-rich domain-containing protein n=2 Tax=Vitrella brassicaformis TaxID=1169539 RepID=A0A0G4GEY9_VITBC|nr:unnamed protein product [Vitrella brassicaformis CCMP3155]|eukprot:CEM28072.1 unnamed protein product [Vitrella brassicaformis CCMP3155]
MRSTCLSAPAATALLLLITSAVLLCAAIPSDASPALTRSLQDDTQALKGTGAGGQDKGEKQQPAPAPAKPQPPKAQPPSEQQSPAKQQPPKQGDHNATRPANDADSDPLEDFTTCGDNSPCTDPGFHCRPSGSSAGQSRCVRCCDTERSPCPSAFFCGSASQDGFCGLGQCKNRRKINDSCSRFSQCLSGTCKDAKCVAHQPPNEGPGNRGKDKGGKGKGVPTDGTGKGKTPSPQQPKPKADGAAGGKGKEKQQEWEGQGQGEGWEA